MRIEFQLNGANVVYDVTPGQTLLAALRAHGLFGVKHGCETGECGACAVLVDGVPANSCVMLAAQAAGRSITTIEGVGGEQMRGWRGSEPLHALQTAFVETGAIQCGYCTPGMILAAKARAQGYDWRSHFADFRFKEKMKKARPEGKKRTGEGKQRRKKKDSEQE